MIVGLFLGGGGERAEAAQAREGQGPDADHQECRCRRRRRTRGGAQLGHHAGFQAADLVGGADEDDVDRGDAAAHVVGGEQCTSVWRTTTLMLSSAPVRKSIAQESQKLRDRPKMMVASPKPATASSMARPARRMGGRCASRMAMQKAPTAGAARSQPNPCAPTLQDIFREHRQQVHRAAQQHGEQIERDGASSTLRLHTKCAPAHSAATSHPPGVFRFTRSESSSTMKSSAMIFSSLFLRYEFSRLRFLEVSLVSWSNYMTMTNKI